MSFKSIKETYGISADYITYTGCLQAVKCYTRKTGITLENNSSVDLIKTLKVIYSGRKGARLYYEVLTHDANKPNCCEKWETKLNKDINWSISFKKIQRIREIKLKWFQIRLVHRILATNVVLMHMGVNNDFDCSFCEKREIVLIIFFGDVIV